MQVFQKKRKFTKFLERSRTILNKGFSGLKSTSNIVSSSSLNILIFLCKIYGNSINFYNFLFFFCDALELFAVMHYEEVI